MTALWEVNHQGVECFVGHDNRECGEHRTCGGRAWCYDCAEWCYPSEDMMCARCELPRLRAQAEAVRVDAVRNVGTVEHLRVLLAGLPGGANLRLVSGGTVGEFDEPPPESVESVATHAFPDGSMTVFLNGGGF